MNINDTVAESLQAFADGVTDLSERLGIGVEGGVLYERIPEDMRYRYVCDEDGRLIRA